jgi:hypothetical protein
LQNDYSHVIWVNPHKISRANLSPFSPQQHHNMATKLSPEDSIALIKANLAKVFNPELIDHVILKEKRPLKVYWGTDNDVPPTAATLSPR